MFLKKINSELNQALLESEIKEANELQQDSFSYFKSGADLVVSSGKATGKTTSLVINVIHKLVEEFQQSPRALIIVQNKEKVLEIKEYFESLNKYNKLRIYGVYEQTDTDNDKNLISVGIDVLIGTPKKLSELFSGAGFDINQLKMFIVDDLDILLKNRNDLLISRLSDGIEKTQRIFMCTEITEKVEIFADKLMPNPIFLEFDEEEFIEE